MQSISDLLNGVPLVALLSLWGGYLVIILTPGPNMLAIGGFAALQGVWHTLPLILGIAVGALIQVFFILGGMTLLADLDGWAEFGRIAGALLLVVTAWQIWTKVSRAVPAKGGVPTAASVCFATGVTTGVTNPITFAGVTAQLLGPSAALAGSAWGGIAVAGIAAIALLKGIVVANVFAMPVARSAAIRWQKPVTAAVALVLTAMAANTARPIVPQVLARVTASGASAVASANRPSPDLSQLLEEMRRQRADVDARTARLLDEIGALRTDLLAQASRTAALEARLIAIEALRSAAVVNEGDGVPAPVASPAAVPAVAVEEPSCRGVAVSSGAPFILYFDRLQTALSDSQTARLDAFAEAIRDCASLSLLIEMHTDSRGSPVLNLKLSRTRGNLVADHLRRNSSRQLSIELVNAGSNRPIGPNETEVGRAMNWRVEITLRDKSADHVGDRNRLTAR